MRSISAVQYRINEIKLHFTRKYGIEPNHIIVSQNILDEFKSLTTTEDDLESNKVFEDELRKYRDLYPLQREFNIPIPFPQKVNMLYGLVVLPIDKPDNLVQVCLY